MRAVKAKAIRRVLCERRLYKIGKKIYLRTGVLPNGNAAEKEVDNQ